jgi:hypothetical protein
MPQVLLFGSALDATAPWSHVIAKLASALRGMHASA